MTGGDARFMVVTSFSRDIRRIVSLDTTSMSSCTNDWESSPSSLAIMMSSHSTQYPVEIFTRHFIHNAVPQTVKVIDDLLLLLLLLIIIIIIIIIITIIVVRKYQPVMEYSTRS